MVTVQLIFSIDYPAQLQSCYVLQRSQQFSCQLSKCFCHSVTELESKYFVHTDALFLLQMLLPTLLIYPPTSKASREVINLT